MNESTSGKSVTAVERLKALSREWRQRAKECRTKLYHGLIVETLEKCASEVDPLLDQIEQEQGWERPKVSELRAMDLRVMATPTVEAWRRLFGLPDDSPQLIELREALAAYGQMLLSQLPAPPVVAPSDTTEKS